MSNNNIIRQVVDIQAQAERLLKNKPSYEEIEQFSQYNNEIRSFLFNNIDDEFVLNYVKEIPDLDLDKIDVKSNIITVILMLFVSPSIASREKDKIEKALKIIRDIRGKYASAEFMLKNHFS